MARSGLFKAVSPAKAGGRGSRSSRSNSRGGGRGSRSNSRGGSRSNSN